MLEEISSQDGVTASGSGAPATAAPLLLHIGLHKTGSTWLQSSLFNDPVHGFMVPHGVERHKLVHDLVVPDPLAYDAGRVRDFYAPHLERAGAAGLTLVLSHERLSGYPSSGGFDREIIAQRLASTFPEGRVLLVIREQRALIRSMYSQHITDGGAESVGRYLHRPEPQLNRKPSFALEMYEYHRLIARYHSLFGNDRVLVLPFELLARHPQQFVGQIAHLSGRRPTSLPPTAAQNPKRSLLMQNLQRPFNMLFYHNELSPGALVHVPRFHKRYARLRPLFDVLSPRLLERRLEQSLSDAIERRVGTHYATSNARTEELTGIRLGELGYPVL
jgi:hypothetical protein